MKQKVYKLNYREREELAAVLRGASTMSTVSVMIDDEGVKFRLGNGVWSHGMGTVE